MKKAVLILAFAFIGMATMNNAKAQTYDPLAVQRINDLIANNGLQETPNAPEIWTFARWNNENPKQIIKLSLSSRELTGDVSFEGLSSLTTLICDFNNLTKLNLKNCIQLQILSCDYNKITELDITGCTQLIALYCCDNLLSKLVVKHCVGIHTLHCVVNCLTELDLTGVNIYDSYISTQYVSLTLYKNEVGEYMLPISLNNPTFSNSSISYTEGILKSTDTTVNSAYFEVETNGTGIHNTMDGLMFFTYSDITPIDNLLLSIYPNPANDMLFVEYFYSQQITVKISDMLGKEVLVQSVTGKKPINISQLEKGIYIVSAFSEGKIIGSKKIIKT